MTKKPTKRKEEKALDYGLVLGDVAGIIEAARRSAARTVNSVMTAAYWLVGRRIVECEQKGKPRAEYGEMLLERLARDLTAQFGRGFSYPNLNKFRQFYLTYPHGQILSTAVIESDAQILSTASRKLDRPRIQTPSDKRQTASAGFDPVAIAARFPLPWSAYVRLLSVLRFSQVWMFSKQNYEKSRLRPWTSPKNDYNMPA